MNRNQWKYISGRLGFLVVLVNALLFVLLVATCAVLREHDDNILVVLIGAALMIAMNLVLWFCVIRPFREGERWLTLLLGGYTASGIYHVSCSISPATEQLLQRVADRLNIDEQLIANKKQAQYLALQNQINPHFLYNTLEGIRSEAKMAGLDSVADMSKSLGSFFRYTISKVENLVRVEDELQNIETYFYIQKYRFGDRLRLITEWGDGDEAELRRCLLPKLTLQPIVENSIIHGLECKVGVGTVRIRLTRTEKRLLIRISDDGVGMSEETLQNLNRKINRSALENIRADSEQNNGIALLNVNNRIHLLFGEEYGLSVYSTPGVGTDVEINLPCLFDERQLKNRGEVLS